MRHKLRLFNLVLIIILIFSFTACTTLKTATKTTIEELPLDDKAHGATYETVEELIKAFKKHYPEKEVCCKYLFLWC